MHNSVTVDCKRLVENNLSCKLHHITGVCTVGCEESGEQKPAASQPITAADEVYIFCVRTLLDMNWQWTCAKVSSDTDIASSTMTRPTQFDNAENLHMMGMTPSDSSTHMAIYGNNLIAYESL